MKVVLCTVCRYYPAATRTACLWCYSRYRNRGRHVELPRATWPAVELVHEADALLESGCHREDVAERLGVKWGSIVTARWRLSRRAAQREGVNHEADHERG